MTLGRIRQDLMNKMSHNDSAPGLAGALCRKISVCPRPPANSETIDCINHKRYCAVLLRFAEQACELLQNYKTLHKTPERSNPSRHRCSSVSKLIDCSLASCLSGTWYFAMIVVVSVWHIVFMERVNAVEEDPSDDVCRSNSRKQAKRCLSAVSGLRSPFVLRFLHIFNLLTP